MSSHRRRRSIFELINEYMQEMESLAEELLPNWRPSWDVKAHTIEPLCNVSVTPDDVIITADLPFAEADSIKVEPIDRKTLEIRAKMKRRVCCEDLGVIHQEGEFSTFTCQTSIPVLVNMEKRETKLKKGILEIRLPRKKGYEIKIE